MKLKEAFIEHGCTFLAESVTNQQFPVFKDTELEELGKDFSFTYQERVDEEHSAVRFCTSWATKEEDVDALIEKIRNLR